MIPEQVALPPGPLTTGITSGVTIRNYGTNLLELSDARVDAPGVEVRVREPQPGRLFTLTVSFPAGFKIPPDKKLALSVKSNHPKFPLITVPIYHSPSAVAAAPPPAVVALPSNVSPTTRAVPTRLGAPGMAAK